MPHEMVTVGSAMSIVTLAIWGTILTISHYMPKIVALKVVEQVKKPYLAR